MPSIFGGGAVGTLNGGQKMFQAGIATPAQTIWSDGIKPAAQQRKSPLIIVGGLSLSQSFADSITLADANSKVFNLSKADTFTLSDVIAKATGLAKADSFTLADSIVKAISLVKVDTVTLTDSSAKNYALSKSDIISLIDSALSTTTYLRTFSDTITFTDVENHGGIGAIAEAIILILGSYPDMAVKN